MPLRRGAANVNAHSHTPPHYSVNTLLHLPVKTFNQVFLSTIIHSPIPTLHPDPLRLRMPPIPGSAPHRRTGPAAGAVRSSGYPAPSGRRGGEISGQAMVRPGLEGEDSRRVELLPSLRNPPDAEDRMSGGVGGVTGAIPLPRPDPGSVRHVRKSPTPSLNGPARLWRGVRWGTLG